MSVIEYSFVDELVSGVFQSIHDSYDELKSSTLMSPKLLAMCGIVKKAQGEFDSKIFSTQIALNSPTQQCTSTIFVNFHSPPDPHNIFAVFDFR